VAVAYVGVTTGGTPDSVVATSVAATRPSAATDDTMFLWLSLNNGTATAPIVTAPSGWTLIGQATDGASPQLLSALYYRVNQASDTTTPTWSFSTGTNAAWVMVGYAGLDPTTPQLHGRVDPYTGSTSAKTTETITTTAAGWIVSGFGDRSAGGYSAFTNTFRGQYRQTVFANPSSSWVQDSNGDVAAGSQVRTATGPAGTSVGSSFIMQLNPATGSSIRTFESPLQEFIRTQGVMWVAHRGGSVDFIEESAEAYASCHALNIQALEMSVWRTSDAVWVASHDRSTLRMFGVDLDIPTTAWSALSGLRTTTGGYALARVTDILDDYAGSHIFFLDNKQDSNITAWLNLLDSYDNSTGRFVIKGGYSSATWTAARSRGYVGWGIYYDTELDDLEATYATWDLLGLNYDATQTDWNTILATNKPVLGHVALTAAHGVTALSKGASGVMTGKVVGVIPAFVDSTLPAQPTQLGSWWGLHSIIHEAQQMAAEDSARRPVACPIDGNVLMSGPNGELYCPWDGWTY
jgi:hypothetical protein